MRQFQLTIPIRHTYLARMLWTRINSVGSILDVACGEGYLYGSTYQIIASPLMVIAPKINAVMIDKRNYKTYRERGRKVPDIQYFIRADAHQLPFKDKSFDTVTLCEILEHPIDPFQVLAEAKRTARQRILLTVPDEEAWIKRKIFRHFSVFDSTEHVRLFTMNKLASYLEKAELTSYQINHTLFGDLEFYTATVNLEN